MFNHQLLTNQLICTLDRCLGYDIGETFKSVKVSNEHYVLLFMSLR